VARFVATWVGSTSTTRGSKFWLELVAFEGSMGTQSKKNMFEVFGDS
jgi:hypothetical protein